MIKSKFIELNSTKNELATEKHQQKLEGIYDFLGSDYFRKKLDQVQIREDICEFKFIQDDDDDCENTAIIIENCKSPTLELIKPLDGADKFTFSFKNMKRKKN